MLNDFNFDLPEELIAQYPLDRGQSKLLHRSNDGKLTDMNFSQICHLLQPGDLLVLNNTAVIPACLIGYIGEVQLKINLINRIFDSKGERWEFLSKPRKKGLVGSLVKFSDKLVGVIIEKFNHNNMDVIEFFKPANIEDVSLDNVLKILSTFFFFVYIIVVIIINFIFLKLKCY